MLQHASNFTFLPPAFNDLAEAARKAEGHIMGDPRAALQHRAFRGEL
jgi:type I restriction enzyme R subunit